MRIGIVAPSSRFSEAAAERTREIAAAHFPSVELVFHPQCFLVHNHFAGADAARLRGTVLVVAVPQRDGAPRAEVARAFGVRA